MSKLPESYQLNYVKKFFANYLVLAEKDCPKGSMVLDLHNWESVPVRHVYIDISARPINRILFGPDYEAPPAVTDLEYRLSSISTQRPWVAK